MIPTIEQVIEEYRRVALVQRMKTGSPSENSVSNVINGVKIVCKAAEITTEEPVTILTRQLLDRALASFMSWGVSRLTAQARMWQLRSLFSRWSLQYYKDSGWEIPIIEIPAFRAKVPRYIRPSEDMLKKVKGWYYTLEGEDWFVATMMLEFAMRNGDILRLNESNFIQKDGKPHLRYVPHKTELSSSRVVCWPIHEDIWKKLEEMGGIRRIEISSGSFERVNKAMRQIGFKGAKAAYELRKICIDHIYQRFGAEMAVSISGDDIRTISRYYADPSQPNVGIVRVAAMI